MSNDIMEYGYDAIWISTPVEVKRNLALIISEYTRACDLHPHWPEDFIHASAVVAEESGELVQAALQHHYDYKPFNNMLREAVQTGAMALRFLVNAEGGWCNACQRLIPLDEITPGKRHDTDQGGCGCNVETHG
jgi:hypothetical protein